MNFNWLKNLFKKNKFESNTSDISTIDTSFIRVPKLSELNKESKKIVLSYLDKLNSNNYENLVKYSDDLLKQANIEREVLLRTMNRYDEQYKSLEEKYDNKKDISTSKIYNLGKLSSYEYKIIVDNIMNIRKELELKLIALDMYIKKEEKRKYDFLGIFGKAERIKYLTDKNRLLNERERLLTSIKIDDNILSAVLKDIKENELLINSYNILNRYYDLFNSDNIDMKYDVRKELNNSIDRLKDKTKFTLIDFYNKLEKDLEEFAYKSIGYKIPEESLGSGVSVHISAHNMEKEYDDYIIKKSLDLIAFIPPKEYIENLYELVAKYSHERDLNIIEHRNDYVEYINEMKEIISEIEKLAMDEWDEDYLRDNSLYYSKKIKKYLQIYGNDRNKYYCEMFDDKITPSSEQQLNKYYYKLLFLYSVSKKFSYSLSSSYGIELREHFYSKDNYVYYNTNKEFYEILEELAIEIYNKYGVKPTIEVTLDEDKYYYHLQENNLFYYLNIGELFYEVLKRNCDEWDIYIDDGGISKIIGSRKKTVSKLNNKLKSNNRIRRIYNETYHVSENDPISVADYYYLSKLVGLEDDFDIKKIKSEDRELTVAISWNNIRNKDDERIFVLPKQVVFNSPLSSNATMNSLELLNIDEDKIAIMVNNWSQVTTIHRSIQKNNTNIKYIIMPESLYNNYKDVFKNRIYDNIIVVPNDTKYSELSSYLDKELEKNNNKVLKKSR